MGTVGSGVPPSARTLALTADVPKGWELLTLSGVAGRRGGIVLRGGEGRGQ